MNYVFTLSCEMIINRKIITEHDMIINYLIVVNHNLAMYYEISIIYKIYTEKVLQGH